MVIIKYDIAVTMRNFINYLMFIDQAEIFIKNLCCFTNYSVAFGIVNLDNNFVSYYSFEDII